MSTMSGNRASRRATRKSGVAGYTQQAAASVWDDLTGESGAEDNRIPILWHSNAPWVGTGYGSQTKLFAPLLQEMLGYRVAFSAFYGLKGNRLGWVSPGGGQYIIYPGGRDKYSNDVLGAHAKHWFRGKGGYVITLTDPWVLDAGIMSQLPILAWVPIDHEPLIPYTRNWFRGSKAIPIAMAQFGKRVLEDAGYKNVAYVPHGYDEDVFFQDDRVQCREDLGIPQDAFVVTMVAANKGVPSRKCFSQAITAFSIFKEKHDDAILYMHTQMEDDGGEDLWSMSATLGVRPMVTDQYGLALGTPSSLVARIMNASDVLLNPAAGEGFGVPLIESQACGTPCITTNFSAMPEVAPVEAGNWSVDGQQLWTPFQSWQMTPSVMELANAMEEAYAESTEDRLARRERVAKHAAGYEAKKVTRDYWEPALEHCKEEMTWRLQKLARYG